MTTNLNSKSRGRGKTVAGLGGLALASVLLLCGAGNAPIENFTPQGAMQADLNAGGHSVTNVATVSATNVAAANLTVNGKTLGVNNALTLAGTDGSTLNVGAGGTLGSNAFTSTAYVPATITVNGHALGSNVTVSASDIATGTLVIGVIPTGTSSTTVALGNDTRFAASVTGLRYGNGAGSADTLATASQVEKAITGGTNFGTGVVGALTQAANGNNGLVVEDGSGDLELGGSVSVVSLTASGSDGTGYGFTSTYGINVGTDYLGSCLDNSLIQTDGEGDVVTDGSLDVLGELYADGGFEVEAGVTVLDASAANPIATDGNGNLSVRSLASVDAVAPGNGSAAGASVWSGAGAPSSGLGSDGDFYFRKDGGASTHLYFKASGSWAGIL